MMLKPTSSLTLRRRSVLAAPALILPERAHAWTHGTGGSPPPPPPPYSAGAVQLDGSTYFTRAPLTGVANTPLGLVSTWVNPDDPPSDTNGLFNNTNSDCQIDLTSLGAFEATLYDVPNTNFIGYTAGVGSVGAGAWRNLLMAWNTNFPNGSRVFQFYCNDTPLGSITSDVGPDPFSVELSAFNILLFTIASSFGLFKGGVSDTWYGFGQFDDLTVTANRRKFISASGKPVYLGANGELPTGVIPPLFQSGDASTYDTNLGTGGALSLVGGPLTNAPTSPSD